MTPQAMDSKNHMRRDTPHRAGIERYLNAYKTMTQGLSLRGRQMGLIPKGTRQYLAQMGADHTKILPTLRQISTEITLHLKDRWQIRNDIKHDYLEKSKNNAIARKRRFPSPKEITESKENKNITKENKKVKERKWRNQKKTPEEKVGKRKKDTQKMKQRKQRKLQTVTIQDLWKKETKKQEESKLTNNEQRKRKREQEN